MIPGQWYVVMDSSQIKGVPVGVTRLGEKLVFWRDHTGRVSCLRDRCVHRGAALSKGKVVDDHLQCPFHGFEYDPSGKVVKIPANGKHTPVPERFRVQQYPTHEAHGFIWIWWGENPPEDLQPPRFFEGLEGFSHGRAYDPWDAHYSRVIENQLDVAHLPFVHYNTIGRGDRTLVNGPVVQWVGDDMFYFYVYNQVDDGTPPKPDTTGVRRTCERLGLPPAAFAYVGDTNTDMTTATAAGMYAVGATWGFRSAEELRRSGARALIDRPGDLLALL